MHGHVAEALELLQRMDHLQRECGIAGAFWNLGQGLLAEAHLAAGDAASARTIANRCAAERDTWVFELRAHLSRSRVLRALDGADAQGEIEASLSRARLLEVLGDAEGAARSLREAHRAFAEVEATGHVERLEREIGA